MVSYSIIAYSTSLRSFRSDVTNYGCNGGNTETAYQYIQKAGGIELESSYPYTSYYDTTGTCSVDGSKFLVSQYCHCALNLVWEFVVCQVTVDEYFSLSGESEMESHMLSTGPISVCLAASTWSSYTSGIVSSCDKNVDHCVQVVGIDTESSYWIVRNELLLEMASMTFSWYCRFATHGELIGEKMATFIWNQAPILVISLMIQHM